MNRRQSTASREREAEIEAASHFDSEEPTGWYCPYCFRLLEWEPVEFSDDWRSECCGQRYEARGKSK